MRSNTGCYVDVCRRSSPRVSQPIGGVKIGRHKWQFDASPSGSCGEIARVLCRHRVVIVSSLPTHEAPSNRSNDGICSHRVDNGAQFTKPSAQMPRRPSVVYRFSGVDRIDLSDDMLSAWREYYDCRRVGGDADRRYVPFGGDSRVCLMGEVAVTSRLTSCT